MTAIASKTRRVLARLPTYAAYIRERPSWFFTLVFGRFIFARKVERWFVPIDTKAASPGTESRLEVPDFESAIEDLDTRGVASGFRLSAADVEAIRSFAQDTRCFTRDAVPVAFRADDIGEINGRRSRDVLAAHYHETVRDCPAIQAIQQDPFIVAMARAYIGANPKHIRTRLWWSFPSRRHNDQDMHAAAQGKLHFDINDWRTIKFFFYITDVDETTGAHCFVVGSHKRRKIKHQFSLMVGHDTDELETYYGKDNHLKIVGPAGTGFAEDPFVFHAGTVCSTRPRLLLEIEFGPKTPSPSYMYGRLG